MIAKITPDGKLDRLGGKILYRAFGAFLAILAIAAGSAAYFGFKSGDLVAGIVFGLVAAGLGIGVSWCFSSKRRLRDADMA